MFNLILKRLGLQKGEHGDAYRRRVARATSPSQIVVGQPSDRIQGLEAVLGQCAGKSVLDIGCHDGTVAAAFADHKASFIDGVDLSAVAIDAARARLEGSQADTHFETADLAKGIAPLRALLRRARYDIVCYLGVHQHLRKQLSLTKLAEFEAQLFEMAQRIVTVRTSDRFMDEIDRRLRDAGFHPITDLLHGKIGPVRSYERQIVGV